VDKTDNSNNRRPYVYVAFAQSASANTGRMLPATEREEHGTIKGKNVALFLSYGWVPPAPFLYRETKN
jgi:hypothetical protein